MQKLSSLCIQKGWFENWHLSSEATQQTEKKSLKSHCILQIVTVGLLHMQSIRGLIATGCVDDGGEKRAASNSGEALALTISHSADFWTAEVIQKHPFGVLNVSHKCLFLNVSILIFSPWSALKCKKNAAFGIILGWMWVTVRRLDYLTNKTNTRQAAFNTPNSVIPDVTLYLWRRNRTSPIFIFILPWLMLL